MKRKNLILVFVFALVLVSISVVSAGLFDWLTGTGKATSQSTAAQVTIGNTAPVIYWVSSLSSQSVTEDNSKAITFYFAANDSDGVANLDDSSARGQFNKSGETTRYNLSCTHVADLNAWAANYSCTIDMWYFDDDGTWTINGTISDLNGASDTNSSNTFSLNELTAFVMDPNALNWTGLSVTDVDVGAGNDPITLNNTGNDESLSVNVTALDLVGNSDSSKVIYSENLSTNVNDASDGDLLSNNTAVTVTSATLNRGNHSVNDGSTGQEQLYFYLEAMNADLTSQSYSTSTHGSWTVEVYS